MRPRWDRLGPGLGLAAAAGVVLGHAWTAADGAWWWAGAMTLLAGVLLILSGVYARALPFRGKGPRLGELLVQRGWLTETQLANALVRHHYDKRPLGQVLVEMKLITPVQLARAVQDQLARRGLDEADVEPRK